MASERVRIVCVKAFKCSIALVLSCAAGSSSLQGSCLGAEPGLSATRELLSRGRVADAQNQLLALSTSHPNCAQIVLLDAQIHAGLGQPQDAEKLFLRACELAPSEPEPFFQLGVFYDGRQQHGRAAEQFRKVLGLAPGDPQAYDYLGLSLEALGDFDRAELAYRMGLARNSGQRFDPMLHYNYGRFLVKQNRFPDAKVHLDKALELAPAVRAVHYERAKLAEMLGNIQGARFHAERALALPDRTGVILDMQVHYLLSRVYRDLGEADLAAKYAALSQKAELPLKARQRSGR